MSKRFSVVLDPCGAYFIWDTVKVEPVMASGDIAAFGTKIEAHLSAAVLNRHSIRRTDHHVARLRRVLIQANPI